jgi:hypothetical protein
MYVCVREGDMKEEIKEGRRERGSEQRREGTHRERARERGERAAMMTCVADPSQKLTCNIVTNPREVACVKSYTAD